MAEIPPEPMTLPVHRACPFDPPEEYRALRAGRPVSRLTLPGGRLGWLVTRYEDVRAVVSDPRFSPPLVQITPVTDPPFSEEELAVPPGTFAALDPPEHTRYRKLVAHWFTMRRIRLLIPGIEQRVDEHITAMLRNGPPVDLVKAFALPIPSLTMAELLGVPPPSQPEFERLIATMFSLKSDSGQLHVARADMYQSMRDVVRSKHRDPGDDLFSDLVHSDPPLSDEEVVNIGVLLLIAGLETTQHMLALGTLALLRHPDQLAALRADPGLVDTTVEELLRYLSIVQYGVTRTARENAEVNGHPVGKGETVIASLAAANRDAARFHDPDRLDIRRQRVPHVAFGHGIHQCIGAPLARTEMKIGFRALLARIPALRLAVPIEEIALGEDMVFYGVHELPVSWD